VFGTGDRGAGDLDHAAILGVIPVPGGSRAGAAAG
jgi:hypothetical protein